MFRRVSSFMTLVAFASSFLAGACYSDFPACEKCKKKSGDCAAWVTEVVLFFGPQFWPLYKQCDKKFDECWAENDCSAGSDTNGGDTDTSTDTDTTGSTIDVVPTTSEGTTTTEGVPTTSEGTTTTEGTTSEPSTCGNGMIDANEQCDGQNLNGFTCQDLGLGEGALECDVGTCTFDLSMCQNTTSTTDSTPTCGDGQVDPGEECDDGKQTMTCDSDCTFAQCGDDHLNPEALEQCDNGSCTAEQGECVLGICSKDDTKKCNTDVPHPEKQTCSLNCNDQGASGNAAPLKPQSPSPLD